MNEEMHNTDKYWIILLMNIHVYMIGYDVLSSCSRDKTDENKLNM